MELLLQGLARPNFQGDPLEILSLVGLARTTVVASDGKIPHSTASQASDRRVPQHFRNAGATTISASFHACNHRGVSDQGASEGAIHLSSVLVFGLSVSVREHTAQHESIADLPLVTRSATVTAVEQMDRDRRAEVRRRITGWLDRRGIAGEVEVPRDAAGWETLVDTLSAKGYTGLSRRTATLAERATRSRPMLVRATLETDESFEYLAGQYIGLRYSGNSRAYSLASSPLADELELCIRRVPDGRLSPKLCEDLSTGDTVTVRGPHGDLVLQEPSTRDMVFLATGTGVAPFKGMIDYIFETDRHQVDGTERDVWLFLGAAWRDDAPYIDAFQRLADDEDRFHFVPCLSRESYLSDWDGETDYVQHALLKYVDESHVTTAMGQRLDDDLTRDPPSNSEKPLVPRNMEVYACGINAMVYSLVKSVRRLGIPPERIESEGFG